MKVFARLALLFWCTSLSPVAGAEEVDNAVLTEDRTVGNDPMKRYFLMRHRLEPAEAPKEYALLLILPGGTGSAEFRPFCENVITRLSTPKDFLVAELVAPVWNKQNAMSNIWPSKVFPDRAAKFRSEEFVSAVIDDVGARERIHDGWIFTLGWSSSGHVLYSSSFENPKIRGAFIAMSRFVPRMFSHLQNGRGKRYYFWHSPDDTVCAFAEAQTAADLLARRGALTVLKSYPGGHGWVPNTFYGDRIREALDWFRASEAEAKTMQSALAADRSPRK
jgi:predicted esterase